MWHSAEDCVQLCDCCFDGDLDPAARMQQHGTARAEGTSGSIPAALPQVGSCNLFQHCVLGSTLRNSCASSYAMRALIIAMRALYIAMRALIDGTDGCKSVGTFVDSGVEGECSERPYSAV